MNDGSLFTQLCHTNFTQLCHTDFAAPYQACVTGLSANPLLVSTVEHVYREMCGNGVRCRIDDSTANIGNSFSKALHMVTLSRKYTWALTFENVWQAGDTRASMK